MPSAALLASFLRTLVRHSIHKLLVNDTLLCTPNISLCTHIFGPSGSFPSNLIRITRGIFWERMSFFRASSMVPKCVCSNSYTLTSAPSCKLSMNLLLVSTTLACVFIESLRYAKCWCVTLLKKPSFTIVNKYLKIVTWILYCIYFMATTNWMRGMLLWYINKTFLANSIWSGMNLLLYCFVFNFN